MNTHYNNILIPIDQFLDTQKAVEKSMELAKPWPTTIHLIHLTRPWNIHKGARPSSVHEGIPDDDLDIYLKTLIDLIHWKNRIEKKCQGITVRIHIKGNFSLEALMIQIAQKERAGLIIIAHIPKRKWFSFSSNISVSLLAKKAGCDILTINTRRKAGVIKEIENLFKPLFSNRDQGGHKNFTGFSAEAMHDLWSPN